MEIQPKTVFKVTSLPQIIHSPKIKTQQLALHFGITGIFINYFFILTLISNTNNIFFRYPDIFKSPLLYLQSTVIKHQKYNGTDNSIFILSALFVNKLFINEEQTTKKFCYFN